MTVASQEESVPVTAPKTIDVSTGPALLKNADPFGLLTDASVSRYLERLRERVNEVFPKARVFVRWSPVHGTGPDVFTFPRVTSVECQVARLAEELKENSGQWLRYDEGVRAMLT